MKKATLTISFDSEKLDALTYHMSKKDADLQTDANMRNLHVCFTESLKRMKMTECSDAT